MNKINYPILSLFIVALMLISCSLNTKSKKVTDNKTAKKEHSLSWEKDKLRPQTGKIQISKFIDIPSEMIGSGCGISFYRTEKEYTEQEYIWVDDITHGVIMINGEMEKLSAIIENGKVTSVFKNSKYTVTYKVITSEPLSNESAKLKGTLTIKSIDSNDSITINVIGLSGC